MPRKPETKGKQVEAKKPQQKQQQKNKNQIVKGAEKKDKKANGSTTTTTTTSTSSSSAAPAAPVFRNKQRVLVFSSRGVTARHRHLLEDLRKLLPHSKKDSKMDSKDQLSVINEICEIKSCNNCIYLESRKHEDLYMWVSRAPNGPSAKFLVQNIHTMDELRMTGNALLGSRPLLSFDANFDQHPQLRLLKELFTQVFGTPKGHPKSKPFIDHIFSFSYADGRIWFRNYQVIDPDSQNPEMSLAEIGPRFILNPIRILNGGFQGETLYKNGSYISPTAIRGMIRRAKATKRQSRNTKKKESITRHKALPMQSPKDFGEVFAD